MKHADMLRNFDRQGCALHLQDGKIATLYGDRLTPKLREDIEKNRDGLLLDLQEQEDVYLKLSQKIPASKTWNELNNILLRTHELWSSTLISRKHCEDISERCNIFSRNISPTTEEESYLETNYLAVVRNIADAFDGEIEFKK